MTQKERKTRNEKWGKEGERVKENMSEIERKKKEIRKMD